MKAVEFVKKFGWKEARECVENTPKEWDYAYVIFKDKEIRRNAPSYGDYCLIKDLKQLIEAKGLVDSFGGLEEANKIICNAYHGSSHPITDGHEELSVAIQLVESVENERH